jgi:translocation and assembly module TamA
MVDEALTAGARALLQLAMRLFPVLPAALCAALGLAAAPAAAWADSPVVIDGADEDMREAILDLLPDRDAPATLFEAERIAEEAASRALVWLRSEGYYGAAVTPEASEEPARARLIIAPGPRFRFTAPTLTFAGDAPAADADAAARHAIAGVEEGAPARAATVLEAEAGALTALQEAGYADAVPGERRVVVDHAAATVAPEFRFTSGARARLGRVRAEPDTVFRPRFIASLRNWDEGDTYTPEALARLRRDLASTGAVSRASTRLAPPGENGLRDVVVEVEPARRNAYELGLGYSTTEGPGIEAEWTRRNFSGRADSLTAAAKLGGALQELSVRLTRPHAAGLGHAVSFGAALEGEDVDAFTREGLSLFASVDASPRLRLGRSYGVELAADHYDDIASGPTDVIVLTGFADVRHDTTGFRLDPRDGSIVQGRIEPSVSGGDNTLGFIRIGGEGRIYESFGREDSVTLAARIRTGWLEAVSGSADDVPPDRRFYAGGGGSVRGYEYNSIYPLERDALGLHPGGQGLLEGSFEGRWRFADRWGAVAFVDAGTAFDDWRDAGDLAIGVGVGVRYDLGFAPLRVDIAFPLDDEFAQDDYALYIGIGQAF